ncbi:hypothetical protein LTR91_014413 [Friedmanniomyces endolithicus]|uniref:Uncharacterized protein n=1 Tax=Friedmanniomyces endolithicus TaxID=329885 RepID=A0AAN6KBY3_9PEZI|nr:hypothetical protein LTR94_015944 [Friedmanniomyces endolithicus]KAK0776510.1 hypothetical protein LTR59_014154 [Friedmanniomyces endolithicus]KAK0782073.1 hypothetical protein LTR38_013510 [Friedmanniomyces endolithicus]KAK0836659.1 hypothetical protein LTR03_013449 [Friedmanniomyces endolithicus]KAK0868866.1 hypothetical protein LTR87_013942 [Friedmanniomyces endolithicus]
MSPPVADMNEDAADDSEPLDAGPGNEHQICTASEASLSSGELIPTPKILKQTSLHREVRERTRLALSQIHTPWPAFTHSSLQGPRESLELSTLGRNRRVTTNSPDRSSWESEVESAYQYGAESTCEFDWGMSANGEGEPDPGLRTSTARAQLVTTASLPRSVLGRRRMLVCETIGCCLRSHHRGSRELGGVDQGAMIRQAALKSIVHRLLEENDRDEMLRTLMPLSLGAGLDEPTLQRR